MRLYSFFHTITSPPRQSLSFPDQIGWKFVTKASSRWSLSSSETVIHYCLFIWIKVFIQNSSINWSPFFISMLNFFPCMFFGKYWYMSHFFVFELTINTRSQQTSQSKYIDIQRLVYIYFLFNIFSGVPTRQERIVQDLRQESILTRPEDLESSAASVEKMLFTPRSNAGEI